MIYTDEDAKSKMNNQREQHNQRIQDSAMLLAGGPLSGAFGGSIGAVEGAQESIEQPQAEDIPDQEIVDQIDPNAPFSSIYTLREGGVSVPSYSVNDVMGGMMEHTDAPVRDAAAQERLKNQTKLNLLSKGLQAVFGGLVAAGGDAAPNPYEGGMTQALMQSTKDLDDKYFREMAEYRDRELRTNLFNSNQQSRNNDIRIQKMQTDVRNLMSQQRYEDAQKAGTEAEAYERSLDAEKIGLEKDKLRYRRGADADERKRSDRAGRLQTLKAYEEEFNDLNAQMKQASNDFDEDGMVSIERQITENMKIRRGLMRELSGREGFSVAPEENGASGNNERISAIMSKLSSGGYEEDLSTAVQDMAQLYVEKGSSQDAAMKRANQDLVELGYAKKGDAIEAAPVPENFERHADYIVAKKKYDTKSRERAEKTVVVEKAKKLDYQFGEALDAIPDVSLVESLQKEFKKDPESAIKKVIELLRKESPSEKGYNLLYGSQDPNNTRIRQLEEAVEDYLKHQKYNGQ